MPALDLFRCAAAKLEERAPSKQQLARQQQEEEKARRKAAEEEERRRHEEEMARAEVTLREYCVEEGGEDEDFAETLLKLAKQDRGQGLLKVVVESGTRVDTTALAALWLRVKRSLIGFRVQTNFPTCGLTAAQTAAVIDRILEAHSTQELRSLQLKRPTYAQDDGNEGSGEKVRPPCPYMEALSVLLREHHAAFRCPICWDPLVSLAGDDVILTDGMWTAPLRKNEHWSNYACGHVICRTCMAKWAETAINDQKLRIKCPAEGCTYSMWDQDLQGLVSPEVFERYHEHKTADYLRHLKASVKGNKELGGWLRSHARPCPDCHVIVSRSEGCNSMVCVCGTHFCYACGYKDCKCGSKRRDIWNPRENPRE